MQWWTQKNMIPWPGAAPSPSIRTWSVVMLCRHAQCKCLKGNMLSKWIKSAGDHIVQNEVTCANINFCKVAELTPQIFWKTDPTLPPPHGSAARLCKREYFMIFRQMCWRLFRWSFARVKDEARLHPNIRPRPGQPWPALASSSGADPKIKLPTLLRFKVEFPLLLQFRETIYSLQSLQWSHLVPGQ